MSALVRRSQNLVRIDLASVRDTLLYIEGDLAVSPEYAKLSAAIGAALTEITRLETEGSNLKPANIAAAHFVPVRL